MATHSELPNDRLVILDAHTDDDLTCVHLPDFTSVEVGPVMSLIYFGELWMTELSVETCQKILETLQVTPKTNVTSIYYC